MMISKAESRLEHLVNSVQDRSIAVGTLELLAKYSKQFLVLGQIIQKSREASSNIYQRIPINDAFNHCREELVAFLEEKKILKSFLDFCEHFKAGWYKFFVSGDQYNKFCPILVVVVLRHKKIDYQIVVTPLA